MALQIQRVGMEEFLPGGTARLRTLIVGPGGIGKTRWASYCDKPLYAACEPGVSSVADRGVDAAKIVGSQDMLDLLNYLRVACQKPDNMRQYKTVVIDTIDAYARNLKLEWMTKNSKPTFTGYEAWGYLTSRLQDMLTRLMNLDMNVVVLAHEKSSKITDSNEKDRNITEIRLQGETSETIFDDFDLVGQMGTYWEVDADGKSVERLGITFKKTPERGYLKDRLALTKDIPSGWVPVNLEDGDWERLFVRLQKRIESFPSGGVVGEIPSSLPVPPSALVVAPGGVGEGPMPPQSRREPSLTEMDKPTLVKLCKDKGISTLRDGTPIRGNTIKGELVDALIAFRDGQHPANGTPTAAAPAVPLVSPESPAPTSPEMVTTEVGEVNANTGEITPEQAVETAAKVLGATVVETVTEIPFAAQALQRQKDAAGEIARCDDHAPDGAPVGCGNAFVPSDEKYRKISRVRYPALKLQSGLCESCYNERKA